MRLFATSHGISAIHQKGRRSLLRALSALGQKQTFAVQYVMSALHPKADMCGAKRNVRLVPKANSCRCSNFQDYSTTSSARASNDGGTVRPSILAVWALMTSSNLFACTTGRSAGFAPLSIRPA